ncbi:Ubiquitin carboxyl-terminal hydrolase 12 [Mortierella sp. AM989]|nr:Ubiquitin carboxyl-terminal hydrolase 12 [Mortierella sp. AM989]
MAETTKLAQRMKLNDGSIASTSKSNKGSKKRKNASKRGDQYDAFAGYGTDADIGDLQDENQNTKDSFGNGSLNDKSATSRRRNHLDTNGGPPPAKKQKPPQPTPPINNALLNYFSRVPLGSQASSLQNSSANGAEARQSIKALFEQTSTPKPKPGPPVPASNQGGQSVEPRRDQLKEPRRKSVSEGSPERTPSVSAYENEEASSVEAKEKPKIIDESSPPKKPTSTKTKAIVEVVIVNGKTPGSRSSTLKSKTHTESKAVDALVEKLTVEDDDQPKNNRSVLDFFKYRPKSATTVPELTPKDDLVVEIPSDTDSVVARSLDSCLEKLNEPISESVESSENAVPSGDNTLENGNIDPKEQRNDQDQTLHQDQAAVSEEDSGQAKSPRHRRLMRASDLKPKKYCESSESASDDVELVATRPSKESKNTHRKSPPRQAKKELSPKIEPEPEQEPEPEPEPEPEHIVASRNFMKSYFGTPAATPSSLSSTLSKLAKESEERHHSQSTELALSLAPVARPALKTYSKAKPTGAKSKKKSQRKNAFSDSDKSGSDPENNGSDDDLSDFMEAKEIEKPDPNQKSITDMFSKGSFQPASSYNPTIKLRRKKLTSASRSILSGGLSNLSNTCYLNSVLQTLRSIDGCAQSLFAIQEKMREIEKSQQSQVKVTEYQRSLFDFALEVFRALDLRERGGGNDEKSIYPTNIIRTLHQGDSLFNSSEQQDAAEFLFYVISQFDDILKAVLQLGQQSKSETIIAKDWQPIDDLFQVGTQTVTHCQRCPSVSVNVDRGIDLTVQIDAETPTLVRDLDWGISATMEMEHMKDDNQRFCEKCNSKEDAHVYHYFTSLPKIMILRLQRYNFKEGAVKIQNGVSCTEKLNFAKWMCQDYKGPNFNYELCAIIVHRGRVIASGHYYVYVKKNVEIETEITEPDGETRTEKKAFRWLKYNDSCVDPVSDNDMARVFSGNVNSLSGSSEIPSNSEGRSVGLPEISRKEGLASINHFDDDMATPYVYIYRRIED